MKCAVTHVCLFCERMFLCLFEGVFSLGVPVDSLFFIGSQLVATSHTGKVGVWNAVTQHWQVKLFKFNTTYILSGFIFDYFICSISLVQVQDVVPITSCDTAGSFLLLGCNNGSVYYIGKLLIFFQIALHLFLDDVSR